MHSPVPLTNEEGDTAGQRFRRVGKRLAIGASAVALAGAAAWYGWNWWTVGRFIHCGCG
jgi:multidrug resistance efflux pump